MRLTAFIFTVTICFTLPVTYSAPLLAAAPASELSQVQAQLKKTEQENKAALQKVKESDKNLAKTRKDLVKTADKVSRLEAERADIRQNIETLESRQKRLEESIAENQNRLADSAGGLLIISGNPSFDSADMREYLLTSSLLTGMAEEFKAEVASAEDQIRELTRVTVEKKEQQEKLDATAKRYEKDRAYLDSLLQKRKAQNEKLHDKQEGLQKQLKTLSARATNLKELTAGLSDTPTSVDTSFSRRRLKSPVSGRLVSKFGEKSALGLVSDGWKIRTRSNALVMAPADGKVDFADNFKGYGMVVILSHKNSYHTVLTGLETLNVMIGQEVLAGEPVGRMPNKTSEMYLELRHGPRAVDPGRLFNQP